MRNVGKPHTILRQLGQFIANLRETDVTAPGILPVVSASMGEAVHLVRCNLTCVTARDVTNLKILDAARAYQVNPDSPKCSRLNWSAEDTDCRRCGR